MTHSKLKTLHQPEVNVSPAHAVQPSPEALAPPPVVVNLGQPPQQEAQGGLQKGEKEHC